MLSFLKKNNILALIIGVTIFVLVGYFFPGTRVDSRSDYIVILDCTSPGILDGKFHAEIGQSSVVDIQRVGSTFIVKYNGVFDRIEEIVINNLPCKMVTKRKNPLLTKKDE